MALEDSAFRECTRRSGLQIPVQKTSCWCLHKQDGHNWSGFVIANSCDTVADGKGGTLTFVISREAANRLSRDDGNRSLAGRSLRPPGAPVSSSGPSPTHKPAQNSARRRLWDGMVKIPRQDLAIRHLREGQKVRLLPRLRLRRPVCKLGLVVVFGRNRRDGPGTRRISTSSMASRSCIAQLRSIRSSVPNLHQVPNRSLPSSRLDGRPISQRPSVFPRAS
jgi:hypothetical protein